MESGVSWSGHERNVAWIQSGPGSFVDVSAIAGLDQAEDGRVALRCDWDGDGDLDLWLRFRSGPTLRFLENQADPVRHVVFDPGRPGESAVVETKLGSTRHRTLLQTRSADGYLAGIQQRVTLALRPGEEVIGSGEEAGSSRWRVVAPGTRRPALAEGSLDHAALPSRVVLRTPLALPGARLRAVGFEPGRPQVVVVEDPECLVCIEALPDAMAAIEGDGRLGVSRLNTGNPGDRGAVLWVSTTVASILGPGTQLDTPLGLLISPDGRLQVIQLGALIWDQLSHDLGSFALSPVQGALRSTFDPPGRSRWFHGMPRVNARLAQDLLEARLDPEAAFYSK